MRNPTITSHRPIFTIATALGWLALCAISHAVTPAPDGGYPGQNTADGESPLFHLMSGTNNTATGFYALYNDTVGTGNTADGPFALEGNTTGSFNTAAGVPALYSNGNGSANTAIGVLTMISNKTGGSNTAVGAEALLNNVSGRQNTAVGASALMQNDASANTAVGYNALVSNTSGTGNTATGDRTLQNNTGSYNVATGAWSLNGPRNGNLNTSVGFLSSDLNTGSSNVALGYFSHDTLGSANNLITINTPDPVPLESQGNKCFIRNIYGAEVPNAVPVLVNANDQLGTTQSSARFKDKIRPMGAASEAILSLKPVTFRYKSDKNRKPQFGLIAEDVAEGNPALVVCDRDHEPYTVRYDAINAMLLNEFLKEQRLLEDQSHKIKQQKAAIAGLTNSFKAKLEEQEKQIMVLASTFDQIGARLVLATPVRLTTVQKQ